VSLAQDWLKNKLKKSILTMKPSNYQVKNNIWDWQTTDDLMMISRKLYINIVFYYFLYLEEKLLTKNKKSFLIHVIVIWEPNSPYKSKKLTCYKSILHWYCMGDKCSRCVIPTWPPKTWYFIYKTSKSFENISLIFP